MMEIRVDKVVPTHLSRDEKPVIVPQSFASPSFAVDTQEQQDKTQKRQCPDAGQQASSSLVLHCDLLTVGIDKVLKRKEILRPLGSMGHKTLRTNADPKFHHKSWLQWQTPGPEELYIVLLIVNAAPVRHSYVASNQE
jgi:hypothetical protein